jgi:hypothetical protein
MALTYQESADLMRDPVFISRIKVACLHYAAYISAEDPTVPAHKTRVKWAQSVVASPDGTASGIVSVVVMDPNVQASGAAITDADLQTAVETAVNNML